MNRVELMMRRRNVRAFLDADPVDVEIIRQEKVETPAGGWVKGPALKLSPQRGRIVPLQRRFTTPLVNTEAGEITQLQYILIGEHDMDVREEDRFNWNGNVYVVRSIEPDTEERKTIAIDYHGPAMEGPHG